MRHAAQRALLHAIRATDRVRLGARRVVQPGLEVAAGASTNLAHARLHVAPGARVAFGSGVVTERRPGWLTVVAEPGAEIVVGEGAWLRTEIAPVVLVAFAGARLVVGPHTLLNGCTVSAKREVRIGAHSMIGPGSRVYDADQHARDSAHPEQVAPVAIGAHVWIAADTTVLRGVTLGDHVVVGTRSLVRASVPAHTFVAGVPAVPRGHVGDRSRVG